MVLALMDIPDMNYSRIRRGQYGCGDEYLLLPELRHSYDINDPGAVLPPKVTIEDIVKQTKFAAENTLTVIGKCQETLIMNNLLFL